MPSSGSPRRGALRGGGLCVPGAALAVVLLLAACAPGEVPRTGTEKIPITTASPEARALFVEGRHLLENLHVAEAHDVLLRAVDSDPTFARGWMLMAASAPTATDFFRGYELAVLYADGSSAGEQELIQAFASGVRNLPERQREHLTRLVAAYPGDERAHTALGSFHFGRREYAQAIEQYRRAVEIDPSFSAPLNQLGYALRFTGSFDESEAVFRRYIELVPDEPNPYDSYAELLMQVGRFDESIANYREALERSPRFIPSFIGIAANQMLLKRYDDARATLDELAGHVANDGEQRRMLRWVAASYLYEDRHDAALEVLERRARISEDSGDLGALSGDLVQTGDAYLDAGIFDMAHNYYAKALKVIRRADVPSEVREAAERNYAFNLARLALAYGDLDAARVQRDAFATSMVQPHLPLEQRQLAELDGSLALAAGDAATAVAQLERADRQDPRVLYRLALAHRARGGDPAATRAACARAAGFNGLDPNFAYVRDEALALLDAVR